MKQFIYTLLLLLTFLPENYAQNTGYLGKKTVVTFNSSFNVNFDNAFYNNNLISYKPSLSVSHAVSRHGMLNLSFGTYRINYNTPFYDGDGDYIATSTEMKGKSIGLAYELYKSGSIAPLGIYQAFEGKYLMTKVMGPEGHSANINQFFLGYGMGIREILFDHLVLGFSGTLGMALKLGDEQAIFDNGWVIQEVRQIQGAISSQFRYRIMTSIGFIF